MFLKLQPYFSIGGLQIHYYALCILTGVVIAVFLGLREAKKFGIGSDVIYLGVILIVPISIIGARLWYVIFNITSFNSFASVLGFDSKGNFQGLSGLAIQGGVIAALISIVLYCKWKKISLFSILDFVAPSFLIGQICGRWGNFFNQELYGPKIQSEAYQQFINAILGDQMLINGYWRHPCFLYEGILNTIGLVIILVLRRKCKKLEIGDLMAFYLCWYGMVRIPIEILRLNSGVSDPIMLGSTGIPVSIVTAVIFILVGIAFFILKRTVLTKIFKRAYYLETIEIVAEHHVDTLIFDLDGTLLNTKPLIDASFIYTFEKFRPDHILTDEELDSFFGPTLYQSFSKYSEDEDEIEAMIKYYREYNLAHHDEMVKPFPGAREMLRTLSMKGYRLAVVSSKKSDLVEHGLAQFNMLQYIDILLGQDDVEKPKPDPEGIIKALKELNAIDADMPDDNRKKRPARDEEIYLKHSLYVGDTAIDMMAAKNAGIRSCGVLYSKHPEALLTETPDFVIHKLTELVAICGE